MLSAELARFKAAFEEELRRLLAERRAEAARVGDAAVRICDAAAELSLRGGKRLRPYLMELAYAGLGGSEPGRLLRAACSIELMQTFLLIHDDVMDRADTRRGKPTVHVLLADGDPHRGEALAILAGDAAAAWGALAIREAGFGVADTARAGAIYQQIVADECYGQALDVDLETRADFGEAELLAVLHYKTTRYTVEGPLHLGAVLAGADDAILSRLSAVARPLGAAFQLRDDVLGLFGDESQTGKSVGGDVTEGKRTLLVHDTYALASAAEAAEVRAALGDPGADVARVQAIVRGCGALERANARMATWLEEARVALDEVGLAAPQRDLLLALADHLVGRET